MPRTGRFGVRQSKTRLFWTLRGHGTPEKECPAGTGPKARADGDRRVEPTLPQTFSRLRKGHNQIQDPCCSQERDRRETIPPFPLLPAVRGQDKAMEDCGLEAGDWRQDQVLRSERSKPLSTLAVSVACLPREACTALSMKSKLCARSS